MKGEKTTSQKTTGRAIKVKKKMVKEERERAR